MKRIIYTFLISTLIIMLNFKSELNAFTVTCQNPVLSPSIIGIYALATQPILDAACSTLRTQVENEIGSKWDGQKKLAKGLGNATAFSSHAAAFDGYHGYSLFGIMIGVMYGAQLPSSALSITPEDMEQVGDDLQTKGDAKIGLGAGAAFNIGINAGLFGFKNWYVNVKYFSFKYSASDPKFKFDGTATTFGIGINYQYARVRSLWGLIKWRGLSFGSGLIYNKNKIDLDINGIPGLDTLAIDVNNAGFLTMEINPNLRLGYEAVTYVIPLEVHTAFRILVLNVNFGGGADIILGGTDITIRNTNTINIVETANPNNNVSTTGSMGIDASTPSTAPNIFRPKLMAGVGLTILGVLANINATWYLTDGAAVGAAVGFTW